LDDVRVLSSLGRELSSIARVDRSYASGGDVRPDTGLALEDYLARAADSRSASVSLLELAIYRARIRVIAATRRLALLWAAS
jgi:hypothetical protein